MKRLQGSGLLLQRGRYKKRTVTPFWVPLGLQLAERGDSRGGQALLSLHGDLGSHSGEQAAAKDHTGAGANHNRKVVTRVTSWLLREPGTG